ncbi:MAG: tRNA epoxyqueuosine(34) reductase QueG [Chloroflexi bacterium]|nr:tRNA epoxyqueuosine(34) reductase QueG [Chloroflexota bacterium]
MTLATTLQHQAAHLGFNRIGITPATPSPTLDAYLAWVEAQHYGEMAYLARPDRVARRQDLSVILPQARSLIMVALDYSTLQPPADLLNDPTRGRISNYAWGVDYHELMTPRLEALAKWLRNHLPPDETMQWRVYVDTGPILERSHAQQAGLGFIGKNTMLIHPKAGSHFFLGEILTTYAFDRYDTPHRATMCGNCTRCLNACPTHAFPQPYVLDARKCISYLTIELKNAIPIDLRPRMGNWVYGCDICQQVCPWNRFAIQTLETDFFPVIADQIAPSLFDLLALTEDTFRERFAQSPILRIGRARLVRNACVAAGNSGQGGFLEILQGLANHDESPLVREHAAWAIRQLTSQD